jgi:hypothetical protein
MGVYLVVIILLFAYITIDLYYYRIGFFILVCSVSASVDYAM